MEIQKISFNGKGAYNSVLKTFFKEGKFPSVTNGFYGGKLTRNNVSLEHLNPVSRGGREHLANLVLATKKRNSARGTHPLRTIIDPAKVKAYLDQFRGIKIENFDGDTYVSLIEKKLQKMKIFLDSISADRKVRTKPVKTMPDKTRRF